MKPETGNRKPFLSLLLLATLILSGSGCQQQVSEHHATFAVFGTQVSATVRGVDQDRAEQAFGPLGRDFQRMHRQWHPWEPGALTELNQALPRGEWVETTPELIELIKASQAMEALSGGRFNAGVGGLIRLWGFHTSEYPITEPPPDSEAIAGLVDQGPSALEIQVDGQRVRSSNPAVQLDFGGIAKGLAARLACERLAEFSIIDAMIDLGGDVMICGARARPWRVAVADIQGRVIDTIEVTEPMAVFSSGIRHRYREWDGERYPHILDPSTGHPVDAIFQVTVVDPDPILADSGATALVVAGPDQWREVARGMGMDRVMVIDADGQVMP